MTFSVGRHASSKRIVFFFPAWFLADSGTNLLKQGEIVVVLPYDPKAQWTEYLHAL